MEKKSGNGSCNANGRQHLLVGVCLKRQNISLDQRMFTEDLQLSVAASPQEELTYMKICCSVPKKTVETRLYTVPCCCCTLVAR